VDAKDSLFQGADGSVLRFMSDDIRANVLFQRFECKGQLDKFLENVNIIMDIYNIGSISPGNDDA